MTLLEMLNKAAGYLAEKGIDSARLDAEVLLATLLGVQRLDLYLQFDRPVQKSEQDAYRERIRRRAGFEPVAYIVGSREFYSMPFAVTPAVLIPRPETEIVVERALDLIEGVKSPRVADVGTGSGCIACAIASERQDARVWASEISAEAAAVARKNARALSLDERVTVLEGDGLEPLSAHAPFDLIISNPPYVKSADVESLAPDLKDHEPRLALDGGPDGLDVYRRLIEAAPALLAEGGWLVFETGYDTAAPVRDLLESAGPFTSIELHPDLNRIDRVLVAQRAAALQAQHG